jgi:hypothetical protein
MVRLFKTNIVPRIFVRQHTRSHPEVKKSVLTSMLFHDLKRV